MRKSKNNSFAGKLTVLSLCFAMLLGFNACQDDVDGDIVTFESIQVGTFLENDPDQYSEFVSLLKSVDMFDLLNTYGVYTCFVPTNEAVRSYYAANGLSFEQLNDSIRRHIIENHLVSGKIGTKPIKSIDFPIGSLSSANMNNQFLRIGTRGGSIFLVNDTAKIVNRDQEVHNGVIHTIDRVLETPSAEINDQMQSLTDFSLFYQAMSLTAMIDSLYLIENNFYSYQGRIKDIKGSSQYGPHGGFMETPPFCNYGYTVFMESDETLARAGITTLDELIKYSEDIYYKLFPLKGNTEEQSRIKADYTDRNNALNRFISYHIMDRKMDVNDFINPKWEKCFVDGTIVRDYYEMMMPNSLIEVQSRNVINKNMYDTNTNDPEQEAREIKITKNIKDLLNVSLLEINNMLTYDGVENNVLNKRLRMDMTNMIPELSTNKLRGANEAGEFPYMALTNEFFAGNPRSRITCTKETQFQHIGSDTYWNLYSDEFLFCGKYDFTITTPPIPPGRWEVRMSYTANSVRGVAQMFLNGKPVGIPLDMRVTGANPAIGWVADRETDDNGVENDKMMRNRGYMKGVTSILQASSKTVVRTSSQVIRRIISIEEVTEAQPFTLRFKSVEDRQDREFMIDYFEFVPTSYLEIEKRD
ncbi:MAG: fasciclin domain-containing protein [Dysgonamonadaceae bacterium]|jgi:uncharacterized surface protein with fasciclin (FAS1) repeats|nr:fasciclin domain-containing protein [Dysgonamonadaceae bacterium]